MQDYISSNLNKFAIKLLHASPTHNEEKRLSLYINGSQPFR